MRVSKQAIQGALLSMCFIGFVATGCGEEETSATATSSAESGETAGGSNTSGSESEPAKKLSPEESVQATLSAWCASQKRGGFEAYSGFYASSFEGVRRTAKRKAKTFDRKGWMKDRRPTFDSPVKVDCLNPKIDLSSDKKRAEVVFEQYWRSSTYADQGDKKVIFEDKDGKWLLISEDMLNSKKWDRKNFRDGKPATAGPAKVKVGRLRLRKVRALTSGRDKPMSGEPGSGMDFVSKVCNSGKPWQLRGFQLTPKPPKGAQVAAYRYKVRGSTTTYEDDEGYFACNEKRLKELGRGEVSVDGDTIQVALAKAMASWPCYYKIEVKAVDAEGVPLAKGRTTGGIGCPE